MVCRDAATIRAGTGQRSRRNYAKSRASTARRRRPRPHSWITSACRRANSAASSASTFVGSPTTSLPRIVETTRCWSTGATAEQVHSGATGSQAHAPTPCLTGSWRTLARQWDRLGLPRLRCTLRRVRGCRAAALGVVGQRRRCRAAALGVVGQRRRCRAAALGVVGQRRRCRAAALGVVGQRRRCRAAALGVVGQRRRCRAAALGVVGQRRRCRAAALGVVGQRRRCRAAALGVVGQRRRCRAAALGVGVVVCPAGCLAIVPCAASTRFAHLTRRFSRQTLSTRHDRYTSHLQR